jgi:hypothetical protein
MVRWLMIGVCVLLLTGCASRWEHASKRPSEFYADDRDCQIETGGASKAIEPGSDRMTYESCMWEKGWHKKVSIWFFDPGSN